MSRLERQVAFDLQQFRRWWVARELPLWICFITASDARQSLAWCGRCCWSYNSAECPFTYVYYIYFRVRNANRVLRSKCQYDKMQETAYFAFFSDTSAEVYREDRATLVTRIFHKAKVSSRCRIFFFIYTNIEDMSSKKWRLQVFCRAI